jgi:signal transduction histidine kinase
MTLSLRQRILWWSVASSLAILLVAFVLVDEAFRSTILTDQRENLESGTRLAEELQRSEMDASLDHIATVAATPTLRAAIETGDSTTIQQNLDLLLDPAEAEWLAVATPNGTILAATPRTPARAEHSAALVRESRYYDTGDLWHDGDQLVQVYASGIFIGPAHLGTLIGGAPIGGTRVARLQSATQQRIAFLADGELAATDSALDERERRELVRVWSDGAPADSLAAVDPERTQVREFSLAGIRYLGATLPLPDATGRPVGRLVAFRSLHEAMRPARDLRLALLVIVVVSLVVAFGSSYLLSRSVVRPVNRLLQETVRLGSGDLDQPIHPERDDEIGKLAQGFEQMRLSLRHAREELLRAERLSAVGRAASAIVHDFRQPITVIQGYVKLLKEDLDDKAQCEEDLTLIESELARLDAMMGEILDYARGGDGIELSYGETRELLEEVVRPVRLLLEEKGISLRVDHGHAGGWQLDFPRTRRVLENLVRNAAAVVKPGGSVWLRSQQTGEGLRLVVEDTGPGIPEEIRENLFEPFVTHGKAEGTGLGLAIVKAFTERQGGSVGFETSNAGTRFILDFPAKGAA